MKKLITCLSWLVIFTFGSLEKAYSESRIKAGINVNRGLEACAGLPDEPTCKDTGFGFVISYERSLSKDLDVEFTLQHLRGIESNFKAYYRVENVKVSGNAITGFLKKAHVISPNAELYGKLGLSFWRGKHEQDMKDPRPEFAQYDYRISETYSDFSLAFGAGVRKGWFSTEYTYYNDVDGENISQVTFGLSRKI